MCGWQACVLHELVGLACAKPGSKFLEVYAHAGRGRSRTRIALQVSAVCRFTREIASVFVHPKAQDVMRCNVSPNTTKKAVMKND